MLRSLCIVLLVAAISRSLASVEESTPEATTDLAWVRTSDGWEPPSALLIPPRLNRPSLHPGLVAAFQGGLSLIGLLAFAVPARAVDPAASPVPKPRRRHAAAM